MVLDPRPMIGAEQPMTLITSADQLSLTLREGNIRLFHIALLQMLYLLKDMDTVRIIGASLVLLFLLSVNTSITPLRSRPNRFGPLKAARPTSVTTAPHSREAVRRYAVFYSKIKGYKETLDLFRSMGSFELDVDSYTCNFALKACFGLRDYEAGREIIRIAFDRRISDDRFLGSSMISFLVKFDDIDEARRIFDGMLEKDVVCWNSMLGGYVKACQYDKAFGLFHSMCECRIRPSPVTMVSLIQACGGMKNIEFGKCVHGCVLGLGMGDDILVLTSLVDMYSKMGDIGSAHSVFEGMSVKNLVSWNAMISGCVQNGSLLESFVLFRRLVVSGGGFDSGTIVSLLQGCAQIADLRNGKIIHCCILRRGLELNLILCTALVDLYSKCSALKQARFVFDRMNDKNVITWTAMLVGLAQNGIMIKEGVRPNETTFVSLLTACSHSGLVEEGIDFFYGMETHYKIRPTEKHYACLVDLLGRAGRLEEAEAVINQMPFTPGSSVFEALLSGCRTHKNIDMGIRTGDRLLRLDAMNPGTHIMLSNIYAEARRWDAVNHIRSLMRRKGLRKTPGYSLIEVKNQVHSFFAGDDSHPNWAEIHQLLEKLRSVVEAIGYVPETSCVLRDVDEPTKIKLLWRHSERLAIAFGLLSTPAGSLIRITKNLRVCVDCHTLTKYISKVVKREIIVRDANRFHHFIDGNCSCNDYW
ncbi:hypothetical protein JRO89_XS04G0176700 [Xanthoceras sorbifolium]|uniref:DYW domain-containing protein n=1 Tax=Xanthoceras sorbifolium TaxID=99658 RepID=A0ABQ8I5Q7_9ROSI|nr:hypothetical protein JRO89_XS04G0176700 [Xanthoceras sorbifolium]